MSGRVSNRISNLQPILKVVLAAAAPIVVHLLLGAACRALRQDCHIASLNFSRVSGLTRCMKNDDPFGFSFLQIIGSVIIVGVVGIALINYLIADFAHLL